MEATKSMEDMLTRAMGSLEYWLFNDKGSDAERVKEAQRVMIELYEKLNWDAPGTVIK